MVTADCSYIFISWFLDFAIFRRVSPLDHGKCEYPNVFVVSEENEDVNASKSLKTDFLFHVPDFGIFAGDFLWCWFVSRL